MSAKNKNDIFPMLWSFPINSDDIGTKESRYNIEADENQKREIAKLYDIVSVKSLSSEIRIKREQGGRVIYVKGLLKSKIIQACIITAKPIESEINQEFEAWYADPNQAVSINKARNEIKLKSGASEIEILDEKDDPEAIIDGKIDIADLVMQYFSLSINPYPRSVEPAPEENIKKTKPSECRKKPFEALKNWKNLKEISKD